MLVRSELLRVRAQLSSLAPQLELRSRCLFTMVEDDGLSARLRSYISELRTSLSEEFSSQFEARLQRLKTLFGLPTAEESDREGEERLVHNISSPMRLLS